MDDLERANESEIRKAKRERERDSYCAKLLFKGVLWDREQEWPHQSRSRALRQVRAVVCGVYGQKPGALCQPPQRRGPEGLEKRTGSPKAGDRLTDLPFWPLEAPLWGQK